LVYTVVTTVSNTGQPVPLSGCIAIEYLHGRARARSHTEKWTAMSQSGYALFHDIPKHPLEVTVKGPVAGTESNSEDDTFKLRVLGTQKIG
jgi:hypothetical protein